MDLDEYMNRLVMAGVIQAIAGYRISVLDSGESVLNFQLIDPVFLDTPYRDLGQKSDFWTKTPKERSRRKKHGKKKMRSKFEKLPKI